MSDSRSPNPLIELTRVRLLELFREPEAVFWVFVFPLVLALSLGIAFREAGPDTLRVGVAGPGAEDLVLRLDRRSAIDSLDVPVAWRLLPAGFDVSALRSGRVAMVVEASGDPDRPALNFRYDPTRPEAAVARAAADAAIQEAFGRTDPMIISEDPVTAKGGRYIDFLLPGLIGLNVMGNCMWGIGYAIVDARRRKLLKRFVVTPMNRAHYLLSYAVSRLVFLALEVLVLGVFGWLVFGVEPQGSVALLAAVALAGTLSFAGLSLLIACRTASTEAASGLMSMVQLPMWLVSGTFFSYERFPQWLHPAIRALPLTAFNDAARAVMNEGAGLAAAGGPIAVMCAWGGLSFVAALFLFRWR